MPFDGFGTLTAGKLRAGDRLRAALAPHVAWVRRLHERMDRRHWRRDDPLYRQVLAARLEWRTPVRR